jgi:AcrR family transcriptional regulator
MPNRRGTLLDAAIQVLGERGMRALTHRAVDAQAGLAAGSTANYFQTRERLLEAIVERVSAIEREDFDEIAAGVRAASPPELGRALAGWVQAATGARRALTLARYAILVESGHNAAIRGQLAATGSRVNAWFANWLRLIGSTDADHDVHVVGNYLTGLMLHQLAMPDPEFDPADKITALLVSLVRTVSEPAGKLREEPMARVSESGSEVWAAIDDQRRTLVALLEGLSAEEWLQPSLCDAWRVRDVAAHRRCRTSRGRRCPG